jgi:hypothetical protein
MTALKRHLVSAYMGTVVGVSAGLVVIHAASGAL